MSNICSFSYLEFNHARNAPGRHSQTLSSLSWINKEVLIKDTGTVGWLSEWFIHSVQCLNVGLFHVIPTNTQTNFRLDRNPEKKNHFQNQLLMRTLILFLQHFLFNFSLGKVILSTRWRWLLRGYFVHKERCFHLVMESYQPK